jgi:O-antigen/teichoic acid export membrane protein
MRRLPDIIKTHIYQQYLKSPSIIFLVILIAKGISLIWRIAIARIGPAALGFTELALQFIAVLSAVSLAGFQTSLTRFSSIEYFSGKKGKAQAYLYLALRYSLTIALAASLFFLFFPDIAVQLTNQSLPKTALLALVAAVPFAAASEIISSYLVAVKDNVGFGINKYLSLPLLRLIFLLIFFLLFKQINNDFLIIHLVFAFIGASLVGSLLVWNKGFAKPGRLTTGQRRQFVRYTIPMSGSLVLFVAGGFTDAFIITRILPLEDFGIFTAGLVLADSAGLILAPFLNTFQAALAPYHDSMDKGLKHARKIIMIMVMAAAIFSFPLITLRNLVTVGLFGEKYESAGIILLILLFSKIIEEALVLPLRHILDFYNQTKATFAAMAGIFLLKIALSFWLVSAAGIEGAAYANLMASGAHALLIALLISRQLHRTDPAD